MNLNEWPVFFTTEKIFDVTDVRRHVIIIIIIITIKARKCGCHSAEQ